MQRRLSGIAAIIALLSWAPTAYGQQAAERFIPVGQSPGISGKYSYIGEIQQVDEQNRTITVAGAAGARTIKVTDQTKIWLDRSQLRLTNQTGTMADLRVGRRVEIKYADYTTRESAEWIKVVVAGTG
ncbi:MAG: hypothetical protein V3W34_04080 [Phycisphaerae bacterium]